MQEACQKSNVELFQPDVCRVCGSYGNVVQGMVMRGNVWPGGSPVPRASYNQCKCDSGIPSHWENSFLRERWDMLPHKEYKWEKYSLEPICMKCAGWGAEYLEHENWLRWDTFVV